MNDRVSVEVAYYSDVLCIWAYAAQIKLEEIRRQFGANVDISSHYISVFGNVAEKLHAGWQQRGGTKAYSDHVKHIAENMPHIDVHRDIWTRNIPPSSASCHVFLKAVQLLEAKGGIGQQPVASSNGRTLSEETAWQMRLAFFRDVQNIAELECLLRIAEQLNLPTGKILTLINNGEAHAAFSSDLEMQTKQSIQGSPTFVLNEGRQILYGNVGYRVIEANIQELLETPEGQASWC